MFAVLHVPNFSLQALLRTHADAARRPLALLRDEQRQSPVLACNAAARAAGVTEGLTGPQALARCAALVLRVADPAAEAEADAALLTSAFSISPAVEATAPGLVTIALTGHSPETSEQLLRSALAVLMTLGLSVTAGIAATPLLAAYAARQTESLLIVENPRVFLAPLPLAIAEPPAALGPILAGWGLRTLGDLTALPKADVAQRLGPDGLALWERAAGETQRPLRRAKPALTFVAYYASQHEFTTVEPVLFILRRFVDRLALDLHNAGLAATVLTLTLGDTDEKTCVREVRLPEPSARADIFFRTLHTWLENLHTDAPLKSVRLDIEPTRALIRQHTLFENTLIDAHGFAETLARVAALIGSERVGTPRQADTHRPDTFTLHPPAASLAPLTPSTPFTLRGLPLRRFRPPRAVTVELTGGWPSYVWADDLHVAIIAAHGPHRLSGDWWEGSRAWARDEWDIEIASGGLYRLVCDHLTHAWSLEGEYD